MLSLWVAMAWAGSGDWTLAEQAYWLDAPAEVGSGASQQVFEDGFLFQIEEDGETVGMAFVGSGTWRVRFDRRTDARVTANRLAVLEGVDPATVADVAEGADLTTSVDLGLLVGLSAWDAVSTKVRPVSSNGPVLMSRGPDGTEEILVVEHGSLASARRTATRTLTERTAWMRTHHFDPASLVAVDRWRLDADPAATPSLLTELRTAQSWDRFAGALDPRGDERWLASLVDPAGLVDPAVVASVMARTDVEGRLVGRTVTRERRAPGADGLRLPRQRADLTAGGVTVVWEVEPGAHAVVGHIVADVQVQAVGGPVAMVVLDVPHVEQQRWMSDPPLPHGYELAGITTVDGRALQVEHLPLTGNQGDGRGTARTYAVRLPEALPPGERTTLRVGWRDRHRYTHRLDLWDGDPKKNNSATYDFGTTTSMVVVLPRVRASHPAPAPVAVRVGVPAPHTERFLTALSGPQAPSSQLGVYRWDESITTSSAPRIALGKWSEGLAPAAEGLPAVRTLLRTGTSDVHDQLPVTVRQLLTLSAAVLPAYPRDEVEITEMYSEGRDIRVVFAGDGLMGLHPLKERVMWLGQEDSIRDRLPHLELWALAASLHAHWWTDRGMPSEGSGLASAMSAAWATRIVGALRGPEAAEAWFDYMHERSVPSDGRHGPWSPSFVLGHTLVGEVGERAFFDATSDVLEGAYPATWDGLQAALENRTRRDLSDFFDLWVSSGLSPRVEGSFDAGDDGAVTVALTSNVPFGGLRVPVRLEGRDGTVDAVVNVVDGEGELRIHWPHDAGPRRLRVDPEHRLLLQRLN